MARGEGEGRHAPAGAEGARAPAARAELAAAALTASPAATAVVVGSELRVALANPAFRALCGRPEQDPTDLRLDEVWAAEDAVLPPALRRALEGGEPFHADDYAVSLGGAARRFSVDVRPVAAAGAAAVVLTLCETTAVWAAEHDAEDVAARALRHASELEAMVQALPDAFILYGPRGEILRMNDVAERFLALVPGEAQLPFAERVRRYAVWGPDGRPVVPPRDPVTRALAGETVRSAHLRIEAPGREAWVLASAAPIRGPDGSIWGAVLTFSDESELHALEKARDDLARMISHDLRTPLNAVLAQAHLLRKAPADAPKVEERARAIARSCERMGAMIQDLLEATLLEAGQLRMSPRRVELPAFVPEVLERLRGAIPVDRVSLASSGPAAVRADPERLERILVNLLSNALKYSPPQAPVTVELAAAPGGATITVADRGIGIAPEDLPHLFERFFRARGNRQPEGIGLGLYITRMLVHAHGGRIEVESYLGTGSAFRVFLPEEGPLPTPPPAP